MCVCVEQLDENLLLWIIETWDCDTIRITCPCALYPLAPHFHIVKLGFTIVLLLGMSNHARLDIRRFGSSIRIHPKVRIVSHHIYETMFAWYM